MLGLPRIHRASYSSEGIGCHAMLGLPRARMREDSRLPRDPRTPRMPCEAEDVLISVPPPGPPCRGPVGGPRGRSAEPWLLGKKLGNKDISLATKVGLKVRAIEPLHRDDWGEASGRSWEVLGSDKWPPGKLLGKVTKARR